MLIAKCPDKFLATQVDDELILVQADTGAFFSLKGTGLAIWNALESSGDTREIADRLSREYDVRADDCHGEVRDFAGQLVEAGFARYR